MLRLIAVALLLAGCTPGDLIYVGTDLAFTAATELSRRPPPPRDPATLVKPGDTSWIRE